jgi:tetratricopeptide (TPR) repeat protein
MTKAVTAKPNAAGAAKPATAAQGGANPAVAPPRSADPKGVDQAIAKAQQGRVNVTPEKAIEMAGKLFSEGKYRQAERVCRQIIDSRPGQADAHNILGVTLNALGDGKEAVASIKRAIKLAPNAPSYHANLGEVLRQLGRVDEAGIALREAVKLDPKNAQALNNLGIIHYEKKQYQDAVDCYQAALKARPRMAEAFNNLGNALRQTGDPDGAMQAYQDALTMREIYPEAYNNLGTLLKEDKQPDEAEHALKKAIAQSPNYVEAHNNLAALYYSQNKDVDALRTLSEVLKIAPRNATSLLLTARIQLRRNNFKATEQAARMVIADEPDNADALTVLGQLLHETDRYEEAITVLEDALARVPDNAEARNFYGVALKSVGRLDEAREHILKALKLNDNMYGAYANLNDLVDFAKEDDLFNRMEVIFEAAKDPEADQFIPLHFAFAKALDDRGEHVRALEHYITGGRLKRAQLSYVESETFDFFDGIKKAFPKEVFANRKFAGIDDERPVFIVGMPRSGSTLVEQILASHPDVYGAGEVKYLSRALGQLRDRFPSLPRYPQMMNKIGPAQLEMVANNYLGAITAGVGDSKRITDKLLTNYFFVGLIHLLFPKAKIIHTMRDPVDTCLSGFTKLFKDDMPHSYDLNELGRYYGQYRSLMEHWTKVLPKGVLTTVAYEDVVSDTEKAAKKLIEFLGLEWDKVCLDFHKSDRPVKTASVAQVRKPIYNTAVKRWKKYGPGLQPLVDAIEGK